MVWCSALQCSAVKCSAVQCRAVQYSVEYQESYIFISYLLYLIITARADEAGYIRDYCVHLMKYPGEAQYWNMYILDISESVVYV